MKGNFMTSFGKLYSLNQIQVCLRVLSGVIPDPLFFRLAAGSNLQISIRNTAQGSTAPQTGIVTGFFTNSCLSHPRLKIMKVHCHSFYVHMRYE